MDLTKKKFLNNYPEIYPMIDELVDTLYTKELNNLIDTKCETIDDRRVFLMFLIMYFYTYLSIPKDITNQYNVKSELKVFLTDIIKNPDKRTKCIELYKNFENSVKLLK